MRLQFWAPEVLTSHQAAARCGVAVGTLCHWIKVGWLAARQRNGKYYVSLPEVQALVRLQRLAKRPKRPAGTPSRRPTP
jgi:hypothetical protein